MTHTQESIDFRTLLSLEALDIGERRVDPSIARAIAGMTLIGAGVQLETAEIRTTHGIDGDEDPLHPQIAVQPQATFPFGLDLLRGAALTANNVDSNGLRTHQDNDTYLDNQPLAHETIIDTGKQVFGLSLMRDAHPLDEKGNHTQGSSSSIRTQMTNENYDQ